MHFDARPHFDAPPDPGRGATAGASRELPSYGDVLVGRRGELARIESVLSEGRASGVALVLRGAPGLGKTALLDVAASFAARCGFQVLRGGGVETESAMPYAGMHQLLLPVIDAVDALPAAQRDALRLIFGQAPDAHRPEFAVALAVLALLDMVATRDGPVLLAVDDLHWIDRESRDVLQFIRRRVRRDHVGTVGCLRPGVIDLDLDADDTVTVLDLAPLDAHAARQLLDRQSSSLPPHLRERVLEQAAGNPLALIELSRYSEDILDVGANPMVPAVAVTGRLERVFARQVTRLPEKARQLLLILAALDGNDLRELVAAAGHAGLDPAVLDDAQRAHLIETTATTVSFRHPLIRSAVYTGAPLFARAAAHRTIATALAGQADRALWHRAAATIGVDDRVAQDLEEMARRGSLSSVAAAAALERAAYLSARPSARAGRLAAAAEQCRVAGRYSAMRSLLDHIDAPAADGPTRVSVASQRAWLMVDTGNVDEALGALVNATDLAIRQAPTSALRVLAMTALTRWLSGSRDHDDDLDRLLSKVDAFAGMRPDHPLRLLVLAARDARSHADTVRDALARALDEPPADSWELARLGDAALMIDDVAAGEPLLSLAEQRMREHGSFGTLTTVLTSAARAHLASGRWDESLASASEGLDLTAVTGQQRQAAFCRTTVAHIAAARGDTAEAEGHAAEALGWALPRRQRLIAALARWALGLSALGDARYEDAYHELSQVFPHAGASTHSSIAALAVADLVEGALRTRRPEEAQTALRWAQARADSLNSKLVGMLCSRAAGILADHHDDAPDRIEGHFQTAVSADDAPDFPFELARTQLAYGQWLRRARRVIDCRSQLLLAGETFTLLDATPWAQRVQTELRAAGVAPETVPSDSAAVNTLTAQERAIVELAAQGLTNREIAERVFLSPRTVGSHLYRAFPKLGVTSRGQLRDALGDLE